MPDELIQQGGAAVTGTPEAIPGTPAPSGALPGTSPTGAAGAPSAAELHELKWKGQTHKLPLQKVIELAQQGFDYTQGKQALAAKEREYQSQLQNYQRAIGEIRSFLSDRAKIKAYYDSMAGASANGEADADAILTTQQAQELFQRQAAQQRNEFSQALSRMREEINLQSMASSFSEKLDATISGLQSQLPELRAIPNVGRLLKEEVNSMGPATLMEAQELLKQVAQRHVEGLKNFFAEQSKASAVAGNPLQKGIEPPANGAPPAPAPPANASNMKFNSPEFRAMVLQDLQGAFKRE